VKHNHSLITLTLQNLRKGRYSATTYHIDADATQSPRIQVFVSDSLSSERLQSTQGNAYTAIGGVHNLTTSNNTRQRPAGTGAGAPPVFDTQLPSGRLCSRPQQRPERNLRRDKLVPPPLVQPNIAAALRAVTAAMCCGVLPRSAARHSATCRTKAGSLRFPRIGTGAR